MGKASGLCLSVYLLCVSLFSPLSLSRQVNLFAFMSVIKRYVFQTEHWRDEEEKENTKSSLKKPTGIARYLGSTDNFILDKLKTKPLTDPAKFENCDKYGVHWHGPNAAADIVLLEKITSLFKTLRLDRFDPSSNPQLSKSDKVSSLLGCRVLSPF
jgi:hypothetical protein